MFVEGAYDELEFHFPVGGMNQNVSPRVLHPRFAYLIENITSFPAGRGSVRNGTEELNDDLTFDSAIIEVFSFVNNDDEQALLYVNDFVTDATLANINIIDNKTISFTTDTPQFYQKDTRIKIVYSGDNFANAGLYANIDSVTVNVNTVTIVLEGNYFIDPPVNIVVASIWYSVGNIYCYDVNTDTLGPVLNTVPLSVACVPRSEPAKDAILIYNGVDRLMSWNGTALSIVTDTVNEVTANSFNRISESSFSFLIDPARFILSKYQNNATITLKKNNVPTVLIVGNVTLVGNLVTITTTTPTVPVFAGQDIVTVSYADYPPPFNFIFGAHDRFWGLGPGPVSIEYRASAEALRVYWTNQTNSFTSWFDEQTKLVAFEDLSDKHGISDNLEAICSISGYLAFIGRRKTQIWQGTDPRLTAPPEVKFKWAYNVSIGIAHGNLLVEMANDTFFITNEGDVSLSKFNITQQIGATPGDAVNPIVREQLASISESNVEYRKCRAFKYKNGPFCGFKIGSNKVLISLYKTNLYSWSFFSGDFQDATTIASGSINSLYLGIGNKLYRYADGKDGRKTNYGDRNGTALIQFFWTLPIVSKGGRFANKRYSIDMEYPSAFERDKQKNSLKIGIFGDLRKTFTLSNNYNVPPRGDDFNTVPLLETADNPNFPEPTASGMRLDIPYATIIGRLKFISSSFWLYVSGYTTEGPIYFDKINLFGIQERKS